MAPSNVCTSRLGFARNLIGDRIHSRVPFIGPLGFNRLFAQPLEKIEVSLVLFCLVERAHLVALFNDFLSELIEG